MPETRSWLKYEHPDFSARHSRWIYVDETYSGRYVEPDRLEAYLPQRVQGESPEAYEWRKALVDPDLLFSALINGLAGQIFAVESDIQRTFQPEDAMDGLGDPEDRETKAGKLWKNIDGMGMNYPVFWRRATVDVLRFQEMWFLCEGVERDGENNVLVEPSLKMIAPQRVMDWRYDGGRLAEVKVRHEAMKGRESIESEPGTETLYTVYALDGWTRYRLDDKGAEQIVGEGTYAWYESAEAGQRSDGRRVLPIYRVALPLQQDVAYLLARKAIAAFNMESGRDYLINSGNTPRLVDESAMELAGQHEAEIDEGANYHQTVPGEKMYYISPPTDAAALATEVLREKWKNLFVSGYRQYADEAAQRTATEVRQDRQEGVEAFLTFLSVTMDEAEGRALFLLSQAHLPESPDLWGQATVERSQDFAPVDAAAEADRLVNTVFPMEAPPLGPAGRKSVTMRYAQANALEVVEEEVDTEIARRGLESRQAAADEAERAEALELAQQANGEEEA